MEIRKLAPGDRILDYRILERLRGRLAGRRGPAEEGS